MSTATLWRRTSTDTVDGLDPFDLAELVPYWSDERFASERDRGLVVAVEDSGELMGHLLALGAGDGPHREIARRLARGPAHVDEEAMVGAYGVDEVQRAADFLSDASIDEWATLYHDQLAAAAGQLGFRRAFTTAWRDDIVRGAQHLAALFRSAAAHREVVVVRIIA